MAEEVELNVNVTGTDSSASSTMNRVAQAARDMGSSAQGSGGGIQSLIGSLTSADGSLRQFSQGLAGSIGLMPGLTFQSFALRNSIMALGSEAGVVGLALGAGMGLAKGLMDAAQSAAEFDSQMTIIRNNTTMTDQDFQGMVTTVKSLSQATGSAMNDVADAFRHASNLGYNYADSLKVVDAGNELAVATGGKVGDTTNRIAGIMKDFGISAADAGKAENTFFLTAAQGNMTMQQLADYSGRLSAVTGAMGGKFTEVGAAMDALTRHGFDASQAQTQLLGAITHIINPTASARKELESLSSVTGVDLVSDFSMAGFQSKGFAGILDDLRQAIGNNADEMFKLVPAMRGGQGMIALLTTGTKDYNDALNKLNDAYAGKITPATDAFAREQDTAKAAQERLGEGVKNLTNDLGETLQPALKDIINATDGVVVGFDKGANEMASFVQDAKADIPILSGLAEALYGVAAAFGAVSAAQNEKPIGGDKYTMSKANPNQPFGKVPAGFTDASSSLTMATGPVDDVVAANDNTLQDKIKAQQALVKQADTDAKEAQHEQEITAQTGLTAISDMAKAASEAQAKGVDDATASLMKEKAYASAQVTGLKSQLDAALKASGGANTGNVQEISNMLTQQEQIVGKDTAALEHHTGASKADQAAMSGARYVAHQASDQVKDLTSEQTMLLHALEYGGDATKALTDQQRQHLQAIEGDRDITKGYKTEVDDLNSKLQEEQAHIKQDSDSHNVLSNVLKDVKSGHALNTEEIDKAKGAIDRLITSLNAETDDQGLNADALKTASKDLDSMTFSLTQLDKAVTDAKSAVTGMEDTIKSDQLAIKNTQESIKSANDTLTQYKNTLQDLTSALSSAKSAESEFANAALPGAQKFDDQKASIQQQIDTIQEQIDQAVGQDLSKGMTQQAAESDAALQPLNSQLDVLKNQLAQVADQEAVTLNPMAQQIKDIEASGNKLDFGDMIDQLTKAQNAGQSGLGSIITELTQLNGKGSQDLTFQQMTDGIKAAQAAQQALSQAIPGATAQVNNQQAVVDGLNKSLEAEQASLANDQQKLQDDQKALQDATSARQTATDKVNALSQAVSVADGILSNDRSVYSDTSNQLSNLRQGFHTAADSIASEYAPQLDAAHSKLQAAEDQLFNVSQAIRNKHLPALSDTTTSLKTGVNPQTVDLTNNSANLQAQLDNLTSPAVQTLSDKTKDANDKATDLNASVGPSGMKGEMDDLTPKIQGAADAMNNFAKAIEQAQADAAKGIDLTIRIHTVGGSGGAALPAHATGTDYAEGGPTVVGEQGMEVVDLPRGSTVTPLPGRSLGSGNGGQTVIVSGNTFVGFTTDILQQIAREVSTEISRQVTM